jgi:hypothetical protein
MLSIFQLKSNIIKILPNTLRLAHLFVSLKNILLGLKKSNRY